MTDPDRSAGDLAQAGRARGVTFEVKVVGLCLVATVVALSLAFSVFQWQDWQADRADLASDMTGIAQTIAPEAAKIGQSDPHALAVASALARSDEHATNAVWFPASGGRVELMAPRGAGQMRPLGGAVTTSNFDASGVVVHLPYVVGGRPAGELVLRAHEGEILETLQRNSIIALALAAIATLISVFLARALARRALRPLYALDRGIAAVRRSRDFGDQVEVISGDEFGRLTENFNALLTDLQTYDQRLQVTLEDLTAARDAADEATAQKSSFLATMSHEIRTPLNGVLGMAQVMAGGRLTQVQRDRLAVIRKSGGALLSILNDILDLSKIEAGRLDLEEAAFDIAEVAEEACAVFTTVAQAKNVAFILDLEEEAKGLWRGDAVRVRQLVYNLVSNALKFTSEGEVRVRVAATSATAGKALHITVSDTGIGIPPEALPRLFEAFVQAEASTTRRFGGTGLGLTICRHIVELMGGVIEVRSTVGKGTVFDIRLPLTWLGPVAQPATDTEASSDDAPDLATLRVLAADDNETNRLVLRTILDSLGLSPVVVANGRQAVDAWQTGDYDVVLLDIEMPVLDGMQATREIRGLEAERGLRRTPIIAFSANAMKHQVEAYLAAGFDGHLSKPVVVEKLCAVLVELAARRSESASAAA